MGTFYVPITGYRGGETLTETDLRALSSNGFEIGAHTISHRPLPKLSAREQVYEIRDSKQMLEQKLGSTVRMFCYPNGCYDGGVIREVKKAGYEGARTVRMLSVKTNFDAYEMPITVQAYPHDKSGYLRNLGKARNILGLVKYLTELQQLDSWVDLGKRMFNRVLEHGGIWHLYGHSWEVDQLGIWPDLTEMLDYVSHRDGVAYVTNSRLLSTMTV
jgi:hypothetical protein